MGASDNLQPGQFGKYRIRYKGLAPEGKPFAGQHIVEVRQSGKHVGGMRWSNDSGEINDIKVSPDHRRRGVATAMYNYAVDSGIEPTPQHSPARSIAGDAWAQTTKGRLPPLG